MRVARVLHVAVQRLSQRCSHEHARLIPEGNCNGLDLIAVVCISCGAVVDEFERTAITEDL